MKRKLILFEDNWYKMPPTKRRRIEEESNNYLEKIKATKEWTKDTFRIVNSIKKGETLEEKALVILKAQNFTTMKSQPHIMENEKLKKIIGDGGIDLFGEMVINEQNLQWIAQCKMTKRLESKVINEMKRIISIKTKYYRNNYLWRK